MEVVTLHYVYVFTWHYLYIVKYTICTLSYDTICTSSHDTICISLQDTICTSLQDTRGWITGTTQRHPYSSPLLYQSLQLSPSPLLYQSLQLSPSPLLYQSLQLNTRPSKDKRTSGRFCCTSAAAGWRQETLKGKTLVILFSRFDGDQRPS